MSDDTKKISELVRATIEAKIVEAFKDTPQFIDELVRACLTSEVNEYGMKPDYHAKEKMPYLTYLARDTVRNIAMQAVKARIEEVRPQIFEQVKNALAATDVVDAFTRSVLHTVDSEWKVQIEFKPDTNN